MRYKAVIFDLDGTLLDTLDDLSDAGNRALAAHGFPTHPPEAYRYFVGDGMRSLCQRILGNHATPDNIEKVQQAFAADYAQNSAVKTAPYDGIPALLGALKTRGLPLAVLSNKPDSMTCQVIERYFPGVFTIARGQQEGIPRKPAPDGALAIIKQLKLPESQILYIGDSGVDMQTAQNAGLFAVGVLWGFRTAEELLKQGADALVMTPGEILKLL